ncbi:MAG: protein kinase [Acidobacteriota bacterium]
MPFFCIHCKSEIDSKYKACPYCGEVITDFLRRHLETPLDGKYKILSRLGVGGMGEVYKVLHTHLNSIRVIKLMRANISADPGAHERFLREARLATKIQHPNVAALFDFSTLEDGAHYMVWEYIEGINLHELIAERGPLSPSYAAKLSVQALHGLDAIHRAGIVHRDISPENLMITHDDEGHERVKIIDLGIAKSAASEDNKTKTGMFVGKWKYCSPEHLGMLPPGERIDARADLYSFGIVMYEMLTGVPPFVADTPHAYLLKHASERPKAVREVNPAAVTAPELEALMFRALEKDRGKRFATAREFAQEIERIAADLPDTPGAPPPLPPAADVTKEATRPMSRISGDAVTVAREEVPAEREALTLVTESQVPIGKTLDRVAAYGVPAEPAAELPSSTKTRSSAWILYAAVILLALVAAGAWMFTRQRGATVVAQEPLPTTSATAVVPPPLAPQGHLGVNAFPWATITSVRNLETGQLVDLGADVTTPVPLDLAPGRYEVTLANPKFREAITRKVTVEAGRDATLWVSFRDPASSPDFGGTR